MCRVVLTAVFGAWPTQLAQAGQTEMSDAGFSSSTVGQVHLSGRSRVQALVSLAGWLMGQEQGWIRIRRPYRWSAVSGTNC